MTSSECTDSTSGASLSNNPSALFSPLRLRGVLVPNRVMMSPMCQYSSIDGFANDWHMTHISSRVVGGAGIVMMETSAVEPAGRISNWDLGIWDNDHVPQLARIARFASDHGAVPAIQIGHAGRKASQRRPWERGGPLRSDEGSWATKGPSEVPYDTFWPAPAAMTVSEIGDVVELFVAAAIRAKDAGFMLVEIHAGHGYLLNQFLSEWSNQRHDSYGGSIENRMRLTGEIAERVREVWPPDYPVAVRISATDWTSNGWGIDDSIHLCHFLRSRGVDIIDVSSGGIVPGVVTPSSSGYQVPFSERIRRETGLPTIAVGLITAAKHAEKILSSGQADVVALGREFLRRPYWPMAAAKQLGVDLPWPSQYLRARN